MKHIIVVLCVLHLVAARPQHNNRYAKITWYQNVNDGQGNFKFAFQTDNGIIQQQHGEPKTVDSIDNTIVMKGVFAFVAPDSSVHEVRYTADENGYQAKVAIRTPSFTSLSARSLTSQEGNITEVVHDTHNSENGEAAKAHSSQPQVVFTQPLLNISDTENHNNTKNTDSEFPDRIGTPAIITLMGPPG